MPDFSKVSPFNKDANFQAVRFGADAPLLETELNELQDIQNEQRKQLIRDTMPSGFIKLSTLDYTSMETTPNTIILKDESVAYVNGERIYIPAGTRITLPVPPTIGSRQDFVLLEMWGEEIDSTEDVEKFGGEGQDTLTNYIKDSRIGVETSRRIQIKWRLRAVENTSSLTSVNAKGQLENESTTKFAKVETDNGLYIATVTGASVDNKVYALPMFTVYRRNSGGFSAKNVSGSLLSTDGVAGRYFERNSIAYKSDGTKVLETQPRLEEGAFGGSDKALMIEEGTTNLISNPSFESGTTGWGMHQSTLTVDSNNKVHGNNSCKVQFTSGTSQFGLFQTCTSITTGQSYTASVYLKHPLNKNMIIQFEWKDASNNLIKKDILNVNPNSSSFSRFSATFTAPTGATMLTICFYQQSPVSGDYFYIDAVQLRSQALRHLLHRWHKGK